jgi:hypothetical protein
MGSGQHFHRLSQVGVAGDGPVVLAIGAGQLRQDSGVPGIRLRSRGGMPLPVAGGRHRVHGQDRVPGCHERPDEQPPVRLRRHDHFGGLLHERSDQLVEAGDPLDPLRQASPGQSLALVVLNVHVMLQALPDKVLTCRRLGTSLTHSAAEVVDPH